VAAGDVGGEARAEGLAGLAGPAGAPDQGTPPQRQVCHGTRPSAGTILRNCRSTARARRLATAVTLHAQAPKIPMQGASALPGWPHETISRYRNDMIKAEEKTPARAKRGRRMRKSPSAACASCQWGVPGACRAPCHHGRARRGPLRSSSRSTRSEGYTPPPSKTAEAYSKRSGAGTRCTWSASHSTSATATPNALCAGPRGTPSLRPR